MRKDISIDGNTLVFDLDGAGPLVVLAHGMGDSRRSFRFLAPSLVAAGYRVANVDLRGCGESDASWDGYSRTDIAADLLAVVRQVGGPAVIIGQSISGGAATIAAATAPELVAGVVELAPFTRAQSISLGGLLTVGRYRRGTMRLLRTITFGSHAAWTSYLELAVVAKPDDWTAELARIDEVLREPGRMAALRQMCKSKPTDAGAALPDVRCPVLVIEGDADPDWADPRAEGEAILRELPDGGELVVLDGVGHYPHVEAADRVMDAALPMLSSVLPRA